MKRLVIKRMLVLLPVLAAVFALAATVATAAPAPKTTGSIGFKAYTDVQRYVDFAAIQTTGTTCGTFWNLTGTKTFSEMQPGDPTVYTHDAVLQQNGQSLTGTGGWPSGASPYDYAWHVTSGSVVGNTLTLDIEYDSGAATNPTHHMTGTIAPDGSVVSGTWNDAAFGTPRTGTFTMPAGSAAGTPYCGKGTAYYHDGAGNWYFANVTNVSVSAPSAWFAARVIAASDPSWLAYDLFAKTKDVFEPGINKDLYWGSFTTPAAAELGVSNRADPDDGPFTINLGNIQVH